MPSRAHSESAWRQSGRAMPVARSSLPQSRSEFAGRAAGSGYSGVEIASSTGWRSISPANSSRIARANPCQLVAPAQAR